MHNIPLVCPGLTAGMPQGFSIHQLSRAPPSSQVRTYQPRVIMCLHIRTHVRVQHPPTYVRMYVLVCVPYNNVRMYLRVYPIVLYVRAFVPYNTVRMYVLYVHMSIFTYNYTHVAPAYVHTYMCACVCLYSTYVCTYECMYWIYCTYTAYTYVRTYLVI